MRISCVLTAYSRVEALSIDLDVINRAIRYMVLRVIKLAGGFKMELFRMPRVVFGLSWFEVTAVAYCFLLYLLYRQINSR